MHYEFFYDEPLFNYVNVFYIVAIVGAVAAILGVVVYFTFLNSRNEGKFRGFKGKIYNCLSFNRFYSERLIKFLYVVLAFLLTGIGIAQIVLGSFIAGVMVIILGNIALRLACELLIMLVIMCRKTVSIDKNLSVIKNFYEDNDMGEDWSDGLDDAGEQCADEQCSYEADCEGGCTECEVCGNSEGCESCASYSRED